MRVGHEVALALVTWSALLVGCAGKNSDSTDNSSSGGSAAGGAVTGGRSAGGANGSASAGATALGGHAGASGGAGQTGGAGGTLGAGGASGASGGSSAGGAGAGAGTVGHGGSGGMGMAAAQFMAISTSFCAAARTCCAKEGAAATLGDCESAFAGRQQAFPSIDNGTVTVDAAALARCQTAYQQAASACDENTLLDACQGLFVGTKNPGEPCLNSYECKRDQGTMTCLFVDNASTGVCKKVAHGKNGDACLFSCRTGDGDCSSQTYGSADSNITPCFESDGLYCSYPDTGPAVCKPILPTGGACTSSDACGTLGVCYTTCQPSGVLHGACGMGCRHDLTCSNGKCEDPSFATGSICDGYAPLP